MHLKSFSMGIGMGMVFVSLIFLVAYSSEYKKNKDDNIENNQNTVISDEEIISRAKELGMTFYIDLPDTNNKTNTEDNADKDTEDETGQVEITSEELTTDTSVMIDITIQSGMNASNITKMLFEKGLIDDINSFETYLINHRKTTKILTGRYSIPKGLSNEELYDIISTRRKQ